MFGLEGNGFIISISLTFLLVGLAVYLFKTQLKSINHKFMNIFQITQSLATSVQTLQKSRHVVTDNENPEQNDMHLSEVDNSDIHENLIHDKLSKKELDNCCNDDDDEDEDLDIDE